MTYTHGSQTALRWRSRIKATSTRIETVLDRDMNGDGHPDLIAGTFGGPNGGQVAVAFGDGALGFVVQAGGGVGAYQPRQVRVADLDCDGDLDVVAASESRAQLTYLLNDGSGTLNPTVLDLADTRGGVLSLAVADVSAS